MAAPRRAVPTPSAAQTPYEADIAAWAEEQAARLRAGDWSALDIAHLADEVEALARTERHRLARAFRVILIHLLKWDHQPARRTRSRSVSIRTQRLAVADLLEESPSLSRHAEVLAQRAYRNARVKAAEETGLDEDAFPEACPYTLDALLARPIPWPDADA